MQSAGLVDFICTEKGQLKKEQMGVGEDRDEDQVVNAEHDVHHDPDDR